MAPPTLYELLGVDPNATQAEIRRAYRHLARRHHPDTLPPDAPSAGGATRHAMAAINGAWEVLGDPARRRAYDAEIGAVDGEPMADGSEGPEALTDLDGDDAPARRPADVVVMTPVLLVVIAVGLLFLSTMSQSSGLRNLSIALLPVSALGFVAAPLFVMVRARSRDRS